MKGLFAFGLHFDLLLKPSIGDVAVSGAALANHLCSFRQGSFGLSTRRPLESRTDISAWTIVRRRPTALT
jgi:hypothetical protein